MHPPTGRWAVAANVTGDYQANPSPLVSFVVSGRELVVPTNKAGRAKSGNFLVLGDLNGIVAITPGMPEAWTEKGRFFPQTPEMFTADGSRVLVSMPTMGEQRTALRHPSGGVRLATLDPTGKKPWKVGPALPQVRRGMLTPAVLGDTMLPRLRKPGSLYATASAAYACRR